MIKIKLLLFIIFITNLHSETIVALLKGVENNHRLHMVHNQTPFLCKPYGVESISELIYRTDVNSTCMKHLDEFRKAHPYERHFAQSNLHVQQQYSVAGIKGLCLLSLSNQYSYSEALLEAGFGRIPIAMQYADVLLNHRFQRAVQRAKKNKAGMWSDINIQNCFLVTPKEN